MFRRALRIETELRSIQAPEYPYPFAIDEMYDAYTLLHQTKGRCIGMNRAGGRDLKVVLTGDSA